MEQPVAQREQPINLRVDHFHHPGAGPLVCRVPGMAEVLVADSARVFADV
jgi:hypothetical protein